MRKIRLGKTFNVYWTILTNTEALPLAGRDLTLEMTHALKGSVLLPFTIEGDNVLCVRVEGAEQTHLGVYSFTLWENYGKGSQSVVDHRRVFALVSSTDGEDEATADNIETGVDVTLDTANMAVGIKGDKGDPFRFEDFTEAQIAELQRPATEAAEVCAEVTEACGIASDNANDAAQTALDAAGRADTAAEGVNTAKVGAESAARQAQTAAERANTAADNANTAADNAQRITDTATLAEAQRVTAENERQSAEADRATAELARSESEQVRSAAETARASAEQTRQADEVARADAESARLSAEQARTAAETARASAEVERQTAESARASAESARAGAEQSRVSAESARATAESQRQTAETARVNEYASIVEQSQTVIADTEAARLSVQDFADTVQLADTLERDLARYDEEEPITLTRWQNNKAIATSGTMVSKANYVVSNKVRLHKGYTYLFHPANGQPIDTGVALCARVIDKSTTVLIDYSYTYDEQGRIATATALYNSALVYTYTYTSGGSVTITDNIGNVVDELPQYRVAAANEYVPMFVSLSDSMPKSGYYAVTCGEDCDAVWSVPNSLGQVLVVSYGFIRSIVNSKADKATALETHDMVSDLKERQWNDFVDLAKMTSAGHENEIFALVAKGTVVNGKTLLRDTWMWTKTRGGQANPQILEVACMPKPQAYSLFGTHNIRRIAWRDIDFSQTTSLYRFAEGSNFPDGLSFESCDFSSIKSQPYGGFVRAFYGLNRIPYIDFTDFVYTRDVDDLNTFVSVSTYGGTFDLRGTARLVKPWIKDICNLFAIYNLGHNIIFDCSEWDTRSITYWNNDTFGNRLGGVIAGPAFFLTKVVMRLAAGNTYASHDWFIDFANVAPTIRLADGWNQEAWDADKLEENEDTPHLLTEENGVWYINDGIARSIMLHATLKAQEWAQEWLALLQEKGYSIV